MKMKNGKDILMDLKEADIGAIFLGEQQTEFSLGGADGYRDGVIRSTGVFLRESTDAAGTVQHVDLSLKQNGLGLRAHPVIGAGKATLPEGRKKGDAGKPRQERKERMIRRLKRLCIKDGWSIRNTWKSCRRSSLWKGKNTMRGCRRCR